jgi:hypothetical protein
MTDYVAVLTALHPGAQWALNGDGYDGLTWLEDSPKPSKAELDGAWPQVQKDRANAAAQVARAAAYRAEADPLFFAWQRGEEDASEQLWLAKVEEVRARHPYEV